jgi:hypothetical protein
MNKAQYVKDRGLAAAVFKKDGTVAGIWTVNAVTFKAFAKTVRAWAEAGQLEEVVASPRVLRALNQW